MARARSRKISQISKFFRWTPIIFLGLQIYAYIVTDLKNLQWPGRNDLSQKWYMPFLNLALLPGKAYFGELAIVGYFACLLGFALFLFFVLPKKNLNFKRIPARKTLVENNLFMCSIVLFLELTLIGFGQAGRSFGGRYIVVPSGIFFILIVLLVQNRKYSLRQEKKTFLTFGIILVIGYMHFLRIPAPELKCEGSCKSWTQQIDEFNNGGSS
jgi:hypothetical protein